MKITMTSSILAALALSLYQHECFAQPSGIILSEGFENGNIDPRISILTRGTFTQQPGITNASVLNGAHAFGFGKTTCHVNCWLDSVAFLTINFPGGTYVSTLSFLSTELDGNWGSQGYIFLDPPVLPATTNEAPQGVITNAYATFGSQPNYTPTGASNYVFSINRYVTNVVLMVEDITDVSEIYLDDLLVFAPPCPGRASAVASLANGSVAGVTVNFPGCGYTNTPAVLFLGGGGTGAAATATVSDGRVISINVTSPGTGYTNAPTVYLYSPVGLQVGLIKAVTPSFADLVPGANYQLQVSGDMRTWTNSGAPFTATSPVMAYPQYWDVDNWAELFFRLQIQ